MKTLILLIIFSFNSKADEINNALIQKQKYLIERKSIQRDYLTFKINQREEDFDEMFQLYLNKINNLIINNLELSELEKIELKNKELNYLEYLIIQRKNAYFSISLSN